MIVNAKSGMDYETLYIILLDRDIKFCGGQADLLMTFAHCCVIIGQ